MRHYKKKLLELHEFIFKSIYRKISNELLITIRRENLLRFGNEQDGGYVVDVSSEYDNLLSFGIADDISFETDFLNHYPNCSVLCYDPSIDRLPGPLKNSKFFKLGLAKSKQKNYLSLNDILISQNINLDLNNFIKMDIEGFEWEVIEHNLNDLITFDNFILEFHFYERPPNQIFLFPFTLYKRLKLLRNLKRYFDVYNVHFNNGPRIIKFSNFLFPECVEVSFINKLNPKLKSLNKTNDSQKDDYQIYL